MPGWPRLAAGVAGRAGASLPSVLSGGSVCAIRTWLRGPAGVSKISPGRRGDLVRTIPAAGGPPGGPARPAGRRLRRCPASRGRPGRCGVIGAPASIPGGPLPDLRRGMVGSVAAARLVPDRWAGVVADHVFAGHRVVLDVSFGTGRARLGILARDGVLL